MLSIFFPDILHIVVVLLGFGLGNNCSLQYHCVSYLQSGVVYIVRRIFFGFVLFPKGWCVKCVPGCGGIHYRKYNAYLVDCYRYLIVSFWQGKVKGR